jgi:hypothetical protein
MDPIVVKEEDIHDRIESSSVDWDTTVTGTAGNSASWDAPEAPVIPNKTVTTLGWLRVLVGVVIFVFGVVRVR